jgi:riboflavin kinase/FMN adenylyltransferase
MYLASSIEEIPPVRHPCALSIGSFDGVHLGHQALISALKVKASPQGTVAVLTFTTHPSSLFHPHSPVSLIIPVDERIRLLFSYGVDLVIAIPFDKSLSNISYDLFLTSLKSHLPFDHLVLGKGAVLGHSRQGTQERIEALSKTLGFEATYLEKQLPISSQTIRQLIKEGRFEEVSQALGRPF